jgi:CubicO group peptidase (beta-lactamase class C family)
MLAALLVAAPLHAQDRTARVDSIFSSITSGAPGCAAGVAQDGKVVLNKGYGLADLEKRAPISTSTLFDIGSTQKQFTAASILMLAQDGRLALTDDIRKHLTELPDYGSVVTVDHLLTHTSGVRDWTGILPLAPEGTDVATLLARQRSLNFEPGTAWLYSNGGYELAKTLVARVSGMSFADFTKQRIFGPLGMAATAYVPDIMQAGANAAMGYQKDGDSWKPYMRLGNNRGGGAIVSTIGDLLTWQEALRTGKLGPVVTAKLMEPATLRNGRKLQYARGLRIEQTPGGTVIGHSGGAAGFSTWMGHVPEHATSVAVACNFDPVSATALAGRTGDVFMPAPDPKKLAESRSRMPVAAEGVDVSGRAGLYFEEKTGDPLRIAAGNGRLMIANGPPLVPVSATRFRPPRPDMFFRSYDDFVLEFADADHFRITSQEGEVTRFTRAQPWTPTAADLQAVSGRYESTELGSTFEIVPAARGITMRFADAPEKAMQLEGVAPDTYMMRMMIVRFRRDGAGKVTGFTYSNPVAQGLTFTRVGDVASAGMSAAAPAPANESAASGGSTNASAAPRAEALTGEYELAPGRVFTILLEGDRLYGQPPAAQRRPLAHVEGTTYAAEGSSITFRFTLGADGRATEMTIRQNGQERTLRRVR